MAPYDTDIMMIGHFSNDKIVVDGRAETGPGGAIYYGSIAARRLGAEVSVVTRMHPDDFGQLNGLEAAGIALYPRPAPETSAIVNVYESDDMERRVCKPLGFAGPFERRDIPGVSARIYAVIPIMAGEVGTALLASLAERGAVALDVQGFVRVRSEGQLRFKEWPNMEEALKYVTYLKTDRAEAELLTGTGNMIDAARTLATFGPQEIVITQPSRVTVYAGGPIYHAAFTPRSLAGRTGRGDTCFATYLSKRLEVAPEEACRWAGAVTTQKQEQPGPWNGDIAAARSLVETTGRTEVE